jgi:hypothetical protein
MGMVFWKRRFIFVQMLILLWEGYLPKVGKLSKSDGKKIILRTNNRNNTIFAAHIFFYMI